MRRPQADILAICTEEALKLRPWRLTSNPPAAAARAAAVKAEIPSSSPSYHASRNEFPPSVNSTHHQFIRRAAIVDEVNVAVSSAESPARGDASRRRTLPISSASAPPSVQPSTSILTVPNSTPEAEGLATAALASDSQAPAAEAPSSKVVTTGLVTANTGGQPAKVASTASETDITSTVVVIATPTPTEVVVSSTSTAEQQAQETASLQSISNGAGGVYGSLNGWKTLSGLMAGAVLLLA